MPCSYRWFGLLALGCLMVTTASSQEPLPSGRLAFTGISLGLLLGYQQGEGSLEFKGQKYPFSITSYGLATIGGSKVDALGVVYDLNRLEDFEGRYMAATFGLTAWQGGNMTVMRNQNGVVIYLQSLRQGLELSLGGSLDIVLERAPTEPAVAAAVTAKPAAEQTRSERDKATSMAPPVLISKPLGDGR